MIKMGIYEPASITRLYFSPPGTPKEQVQALRKAFEETLKDPELLGEAKKSKLAINPLTGEQVGETVQRLFTISPTLVTKLKEIIYPKK